VSWPNPNEYIEAIQYPQQAFSDSELRTGKVTTNRFGLPRPVSGNFATVFEVETERGKAAVRCFMREVTNQQERYLAIAAHLRQRSLPFMVNFEYQPEGIKIRGKWYPILKMDWASGIRLDMYIEAHLDDPPRLQRLGEHWISVCQTLHQANVAHGDLQHGNILVTETDTITLLDYDDMIVPEAVGLEHSEIGHRHYQHPSRKTDHAIRLDNFDRIDNFSSHVIGLSLFTLSLDPSLWAKTKAGDENLLFRDVDYQAPEQSAALQLLTEHADARVRHIGQLMLEAVNASSYLEVPPLLRSPLENRLTRARSWLASHVFTEESAPVPEAPPESALRSDSWIFDHVDQPQPAAQDFSDEFLAQERLRAKREFEGSIFRSLRLLAYPCVMLKMARRFRSSMLVFEKQHRQEDCHDLENRLLAAKAQRKTLSRQIVEADQRYQQELQALELKLAQLSSDLQYSLRKEARELAQIERILHEEMDERPVGTPFDILPANEFEATQPMSAAHETALQSGWDELARWRNLLEQRAAPGAPLPLSLEAMQSIQQRCVEARRSLEGQQRQVQQHLESLLTNSQSLALVKGLRHEFNTNEIEIAAITREYARIAADLKHYERITLRRFVWKALGDLLINGL
jgi:hypothetical protein